MTARSKQVLKLLVAIACFAAIAQRLDFGGLRQALRAPRWEFLALAMGLIWMEPVVAAIKWRLLMRLRSEPAPPLGLVIKVVFMGNFLSLLVPTAIGADALRLWMLRRRGYRITHTLSAMMADRVLGLGMLLALALIGGAYARTRITGVPALDIIPIVCVLGLTGLAAAFSPVWLRLLGRFRARDGWAWLRRRRPAWEARRLQGEESLFELLHAFQAYRKHRSGLAQAFLWNGLIQFLRVFQAYLLFQALGAPVPLGLTLAFIPPIILVTLLPVSYFGLGVKEGAFWFFFAQVGIAREISVAVSLLTYPLILSALLPGAWFFLRDRVSLSAAAGGSESSRMRKALRKERGALICLGAAFLLFAGAGSGCRRSELSPEDRHWEVGPFEFAIGVGTTPEPWAVWAAPDKEFPVPTVQASDITDVDASFVADPFLWPADDGWYLFFEILDAAANRGIIGVSWSADGQQWAYRGVVLREPFHLSYPLVFSWEGTHYMLPETYQAHAIQLYEASDFPNGWRVAARLIEGDYVDSTIFRHDGRWWILASTRDNRRLHLFHSDRLKEGWEEHPLSPVISGDATRARMGGRVLDPAGRLYRVAQDCGPRYGYRTRVFEILHLTTDAYEERELEQSPVLVPGLTPWTAWGMHHLDAHPLNTPDNRWLVAFDGYGPAQPETRLAVRFDNEASMGGITLLPRRASAGDSLLVRLYWSSPPPEDHTCFVHFVRDGRIVFQADHRPPARSAYEIPVSIPAEAPPGVYTVHVGLSDARGRRRRVYTPYAVRRRRVQLPVTMTLRAAGAPPVPAAED